MPRKVKEVEQEIDLKKREKKLTVVQQWFLDNATDNTSDMRILCDLTARSVGEQFNLYISSGHNETFAVIFFVTFKTIMEFLEKKQNTYNKFSIEICNSINLGYTNNDDDVNEKVGNFFPLMEYIGINRNIVNDESVIHINKTIENYIRWKELNVKKNIEYYKEIQEEAYNTLKGSQYRVNLRTSEAIIPLFCVFMDHISNLLKVKFQEVNQDEVSEVSFNVLGLFDAYYSWDADNNREVIEFEPNITFKRGSKNDEKSNRG